MIGIAVWHDNARMSDENPGNAGVGFVLNFPHEQV
jgi:hypothetical protein